MRDYCTGGKTGYTDAAQSTLVTFAEKDGMTLVCVIMNTQSPNQWKDTISLFEYSFDNFQVFNIAENETSYTSSREKSTGSLNQNEPFVDIDQNACIVLPKTAKFKDAKSEITYEDESSQVVGSIAYTYAGREVGKADIVTTGVKIDGYVFDNEKTQEESEQSTEETKTKISTIQINPVVAGSIAGGVAVLAVLGFFIKKLADNYYIIRHNMQVKKDYRNQFKAIKRRKKRRRRR